MDRQIMERAFTNYIGPGSDLDNLKQFKDDFPQIIIQYKIKSVNDAGCGKGWIAQGCKDIDYQGYDIVFREGAELLDITEEVMPKADLIICRDVLFHLTDELVLKSIENFRESGKYLLATSCYDCNNNRPMEFNGEVINSRLDLIPFMGEPLTKIEEPFDNRFMGLWEL